MKKIIRLTFLLPLITTLPAHAGVEVDWSVIGGSPYDTAAQAPIPHPVAADPYSFNSAPLSGTATRLAAQDDAEYNAPVTNEDTSTAPTESSENTTDLLLGAEWSGHANLGASVQKGNSDTQNIDADVQTTAKWGETYRAKLMAEYAYEEDSDQTTEDSRAIEGQFDYFFKPEWFLNTNIKFEQDDIAGLDLRSIYGVGIGHQAYDRDDLKLQYILGPSYLREERDTGETEDSLAYSWQLDYEQAVWEDKVRLFHNHQLLVPADDTGRYVLETESGVRVPIHAGLIASFQIDYDLDKGAPADADEEDTKYGLKIGYEW
jgi:putative salt-induced outer membrane protein YdiY